MYVQMVEVDSVDLSAREANRLKYTKFVRKESCPGLVGGGGSGVSVGDPRPNGGLEIQLLEVDSPARWDQEVIATARLLNSGNKSVRIPYSLEPQQFEQPDVQGTFRYQSADFGLLVGANRADTFALHVQTRLFGNSAVADSLRELKPGEAIRFRLGVILKCTAQPAVCKKALEASELEVGAFFSESSNTVKYLDCSTSSSSEAGIWVSSEKQNISITR
jgi:hypothetical protein